MPSSPYGEWLPFSRVGIELALNITTIYILLEAFGFRPWLLPPWRTPTYHFWMTLLLSLAVVLFAVNLMTWLVSYTGGN